MELADVEILKEKNRKVRDVTNRMSIPNVLLKRIRTFETPWAFLATKRPLILEEEENEIRNLGIMAQLKLARRARIFTEWQIR